jgi:hypothetical protein
VKKEIIMKIGTIIELNEAEQKLAMYLAEKRQRANERLRLAGKKFAKLGDLETHVDGVSAEIAFCRLFNIYPDTDVREDGEYPAADCRLPDGRTVDVKTTRLEDGRMMCVRWKKARVDMFALMVGVPPRFKYAGMITAADLLRPERIGDFGHGDTYAVTQEELEGMLLV